MAIFLSYEIGLSARFSSAKLHKIVDICKKNRNYFIDNQLFILNFSINYLLTSKTIFIMAILKGIISKLNGSAGNLTFKQAAVPER